MSSDRATAPRIGIFDSGVGGLSVLAALRRSLPAVDCSYLADSRHTPWGDRPAHWIEARCLQLAEALLARGADLILVACNTGTTQAIASLRQRWPTLPLVGVEPGIKPAVAASRNGRVAVMATRGTLRSPRVQRLLDEHTPPHVQMLRLPCPGLADAIELAPLDPTPLEAALDGHARTLREADVDAVALGCTHYPLVAPLLQRRLGPQVRLIDTGEAVARRCADLLGLACGSDGHGAPGGQVELLTTGDGRLLARAAGHWLGLHEPVHLLSLPDPEPGEAPEAAAQAGPEAGPAGRVHG